MKKIRILSIVFVLAFLGTISWTTVGVKAWNGNDWENYIQLEIDPGNYERWDHPIETIVDFTQEVSSGSIIDSNSIRVIRNNVEIPSQYDSINDTAGDLTFVLSGILPANEVETVTVYFDTKNGIEKPVVDYDSFSLDFKHQFEDPYELMDYWDDLGQPPIDDPFFVGFMELFDYSSEEIDVEVLQKMQFTLVEGMRWDFDSPDGVDLVGLELNEMRYLLSDQMGDWLFNAKLLDLTTRYGSFLSGSKMTFYTMEDNVKFEEHVTILAKMSSSLWHQYDYILTTYEHTSKIYIEYSHNDTTSPVGTYEQVWDVYPGGNGVFNYEGDMMYINTTNSTNLYDSNTLGTSFLKNNTNYLSLWDTDNVSGSGFDYEASSEVMGFVFDGVSPDDGIRDINFAASFGVAIQMGHLMPNRNGKYMIEFHNKETGIDPWNRTNKEFLSYNNPVTISFVSSPSSSGLNWLWILLLVILITIPTVYLLWWVLRRNQASGRKLGEFESKKEALEFCNTRGIPEAECNVKRQEYVAYHEKVPKKAKKTKKKPKKK